jgi:hypothetical protein
VNEAAITAQLAEAILRRELRRYAELLRKSAAGYEERALLEIGDTSATERLEGVAEGLRIAAELLAEATRRP